MDITKIGHGENPDAVNAIIEVPLYSHIKYEIDKESGTVGVDRVLYALPCQLWFCSRHTVR